MWIAVIVGDLDRIGGADLNRRKAVLEFVDDLDPTGREIGLWNRSERNDPGLLPDQPPQRRGLHRQHGIVARVGIELQRIDHALGHFGRGDDGDLGIDVPVTTDLLRLWRTHRLGRQAVFELVTLRPQQHHRRGREHPWLQRSEQGAGRQAQPDRQPDDPAATPEKTDQARKADPLIFVRHQRRPGKQASGPGLRKTVGTIVNGRQVHF